MQVLQEEIAAVASAVESITFTYPGEILEVATFPGNRGVGGTHIALVVARDEVTMPPANSGSVS